MTERNNIDQLDDIFRGEPISLRRAKAERTLQILIRNGIDPERCRCLEIGTGSGVMSRYYAEHFNHFITVDLHDLRHDRSPGLDFRIMDCQSMEFNDATFDVVLFSHVYQYLNNKSATLAEISRIMTGDGVCFFTTANRFALLEPHYRLAMLGYLPRPLAHRYLNLRRPDFRRYDISSSSYRSLKMTLAHYFTVTDLTVELIRQHKHYNFSDLPAVRQIARVPVFILQILNYTIFPSWVMLLRKPQEETTASES